MTVIDRLSAKRIELEVRLSNSYQNGSQRGETLKYKIKKIEELIDAYQSTPPPINFSEAEEILNQQVGFSELKEKILNSLKIRGYCEQRNIKKAPLILFLIGPSGVGKTTLATLLARVLKKKFFAVALGGATNSSLLLGANENSSGTEIGQLTKALVETETHDPLILLDEIDKVNFYGGNSAIHNCLNAALDPEQNKEILDYYLDVKLDFSQVTFVVTANDPDKIPKCLLSRTSLIIELPGYNLEQKREIAPEEMDQGKLESKIKIEPEMVHEIIPCGFFNIDLEDNQENDKKQLEILRRELEKFKEKKNNQVELKGIRLNSLLVLRQMRGQFTDQEYQEYEGKINVASSREEVEVIVKEFLLKIRQKAASPKPVQENGNKKAKDNSAEITKQNQILTEKIKFLNAEIEKLKREIEGLQKPEERNKILLILVIIVLMASEEEIEHAYQEIRKENTNHPEIQLVNPSVVRTIQEGGEISKDLKKAKIVFFPVNNPKQQGVVDTENQWTLLVYLGENLGFFNYNPSKFTFTPKNALEVAENFHKKVKLPA
ncbi:11319_t:CDS:2 [Racocetra fulgida]|uniref:11319_t:CDS:1 n=1 Tax=Racocetra fulgida TaxID=60492 RepID=A0A9N8YPE5_9GLOM|nr:11319_t:CDS:2 [Racocetra fulgida]